MKINYLKVLPKNAKRVKNSLCWATPDGSIYGRETRVLHSKKGGISKHKHYGEYFKYSKIINNHNGYVYTPIKYILKNGKYENRQRRLHIVIAETFLENPNNYPIVGHKNNIKTDNRVENLYWTTPKENTQKAIDDGLLSNDKGYTDSQSQPVIMFDTYTNEELGRYGSIREAARETGINSTTISRQCKYKKPVRKPWYFRFQSDKLITPPPVIIQYDYASNKEINRYWNAEEASRQTGINSSTISEQCTKNIKPKHKTKSNTYFLIKQPS